MERMEAQIASLAAWVHQAQASPSELGQRRPGSSRSMSSGHSEGTDTYPGSSASSMLLLPAVLSSLGWGIKWLGVCVGGIIRLTDITKTDGLTITSNALVRF